jgi:hypothetical protein
MDIRSLHAADRHAEPLPRPGFRGRWQTGIVTLASLLFPPGNPVAAVPAPAAAARSRAPHAIVFSGYEWVAKSSRRVVGPGPNLFSEENIEIDNDGRLHLRIVRRRDGWTSAEIGSRRQFGYGTYRFSVASGPQDPRAVLGMFTWDDDDSAAHHREIDIEIGRWGRAVGPNVQCVVQPSRHPDNIIRFAMPDGPAVHEFVWSRNGVSCLSRRVPPIGGEAAFGERYRHDLRGSAPPEGAANVRINLWLADGLPPSHGADVEAIVERFEFVPES